jgi:hypothetical protein
MANLNGDRLMVLMQELFSSKDGIKSLLEMLLERVMAVKIDRDPR